MEDIVFKIGFFIIMITMIVATLHWYINEIKIQNKEYKEFKQKYKKYRM